MSSDIKAKLPLIGGAAMLLASAVLVVLTLNTVPERAEVIDHHREEAFSFAEIDLGPADSSREALLKESVDISDDEIVQMALSARVSLGLVQAAKLSETMKGAQVLKKFQVAAAEVHSRHGLVGYTALGEMAWRRFLRALNARKPSTDRVAPSDMKVVPQVLSATYMGAWKQSLETLAYTVDFLSVAQLEGLVDQDAKIVKDQLTHLLFRYMWVQLAGEALPPGVGLTPEEVIAFRRWQIEDSRMPLDQKLALLERMRGRLKGYPFDRAIATLLYQSGDDAGAKAALQAGIERARAEGLDTKELEELEELL